MSAKTMPHTEKLARRILMLGWSRMVEPLPQIVAEAIRLIDEDRAEATARLREENEALRGRLIGAQKAEATEIERAYQAEIARDAALSRAERAEKEVHSLRLDRTRRDCRYTMGDVADVSGSHCPLDKPCDRCRNERALAAMTAERDEARARVDGERITHQSAIDALGTELASSREEVRGLREALRGVDEWLAFLGLRMHPRFDRARALLASPSEGGTPDASPPGATAPESEADQCPRGGLHSWAREVVDVVEDLTSTGRIRCIRCGEWRPLRECPHGRTPAQGPCPECPAHHAAPAGEPGKE